MEPCDARKNLTCLTLHQPHISGLQPFKGLNHLTDLDKAEQELSNMHYAMASWTITLDGGNTHIILRDVNGEASQHDSLALLLIHAVISAILMVHIVSI